MSSGMNVEWRQRDGEEVLLLVDAAQRVAIARVHSDEHVLHSFLAVSGTVDVWRKWTSWRPVEHELRDPDAWGELILSRTDTGEVISIDPEQFWERVHHWFRSRGVDFGP